MNEKNIKYRALMVSGSFLGIFLLSVFILFYHTGYSGSHKIAIVYREGKEIMRIPLVVEKTYRIENENGEYNILKVKNGWIQVTDANCPDKLCCKMKSNSSNSLPIVCLPHKLVISVIDNSKNDSFSKDLNESLDAVVY